VNLKTHERPGNQLFYNLRVLFCTYLLNVSELSHHLQGADTTTCRSYVNIVSIHYGGVLLFVSLHHNARNEQCKIKNIRIYSNEKRNAEKLIWLWWW